MSSNGKLIYYAGLAISSGLVAYGGYQILKKRQKDEAASDVTARQLRGFFYLILASLILSFFQMLAAGNVNLANLVGLARF